MVEVVGVACSLAVQLRNLKVFCDVIDRRSFSRAAAENGLTQSAVSQCVQQLEELLGTRLVDRSKRPPTPTAEGKCFYDGCGQLLRQFETLVDEVQSLGQQLSGRVKVASIYSVGLSYLPGLVEKFETLHPKVQLAFQFAQPEEVYGMVERGLVDFGLVSYPAPNQSVACRFWREEPMLLVASPKRKTNRVEDLTAEELKQLAWIGFLPHLRIRQEIDRRLQSIGVTPRVVAELDNIDSVKHAVTVNTGVAVLPEPTVRNELAAGTLVSLPCRALEMQRPLGVIYRRGATLGASARVFMELAISEAAAETAVSEAVTENANAVAGA